MQYRKSSKRQLQQTLLTCYSYERPCPPQNSGESPRIPRIETQLARCVAKRLQRRRRMAAAMTAATAADGGTVTAAAYVRGGKIRGTAGGAA